MLNSIESDLLRKIAESYYDNSARLVYADWLEENEQSPRSEFIRVQCELTKPLDQSTWQKLKTRERELLDTHRKQWCQAYELPIEDIVFERGLISEMRLSDWEAGKILNTNFQSQFGMLKEIDISRLELNDEDIRSFAEKAYFPALKKLILSNNSIKNAGVNFLASAKGLPQLETIYLFGNRVTDGSVLHRSPQFQLKNLDLGVREEGFSMSKGEAEIGRREYIRSHLLLFVEKFFVKYELLRSAMLCVAQYWDDEANDAVHGKVIVSELPEPLIKGATYRYSDDVDVNVTKTIIEEDETGSIIDLYHDTISWDDNNSVIPLWAAFSPEGGGQNFDVDQNYSPAVMFYRHGGYEILPMLRPQLDGVQSEWEAEGIE